MPVITSAATIKDVSDEPYGPALQRGELVEKEGTTFCTSYVPMRSGTRCVGLLVLRT